MATYYIDPTNGSDSNNGLGPDASNATNKPWKTLGKSMNSGSPVVPGDTVYLAPGFFYNTQILSPVSSVSSVASPTKWLGDPGNAQGFKDASGVLVPSGLVIITRRADATELDTAPSAGSSYLITLGTGSPSGCQWKNIVFDGAPAGAVFNLNLSTGPTDWLVEDCRFSGSQVMTLTGAPTAGRNWTVRRCVAWTSMFIASNFSPVAAATADADLNMRVESCLVLGGGLFYGSLGTTGGNAAGGISFVGNTVIGSWSILQTWSVGSVSLVTPLRMSGNLMFGLYINGASFSANRAGEIVDDGYNRICTYSSLTNITLAGTSKQNPWVDMVLPDLMRWGLEMPRTDFLGWRNSAVSTQIDSAWSPSTAITDMWGRTNRPWGAGTSIGCWETPPLSKDTSSALTNGGANSLKITGAGECSLWIKVDPSTTTLSVTTKSTSYGGTNYPQLIIQPNPSVGISSALTATASSASEQTISTSSFTPTAAGVVEVRLVSRSTSTSSATYFDILTTA